MQAILLFAVLCVAVAMPSPGWFEDALGTLTGVSNNPNSMFYVDKTEEGYLGGGGGS